ncbi:MAG: hypothetical protein ACI9WU_004641 [Myxococcota bacterium]|jgi:hypothetical protein
MSSTDILTVADGDTGELAIIEVTPESVNVRRSDSTVTATNHLLHPETSEDQANAERMAESTTVSRLARLAERVSAAEGTLDPVEALSILRDRRLPGDKPAAPGHRGTIDAMIAAHAVIMDATARTLWVSSPPHTLGEFVAYDLRAAFAGEITDLGALPVDPALADGTFDRLVQARRAVATRDASALAKAAELLPTQPEVLLARAKSCDAADQTECAIASYRAFLAAGPPYRKNERHARARLEELGASAE